MYIPPFAASVCPSPVADVLQLSRCSPILLAYFLVITARLFSVHVQPASPVPGEQVFTLRHNLKSGCNIAFDDGSDRTTVTKEYARKMGLQRLSCSTSGTGLG